jgi:hypothetical protein
MQIDFRRRRWTHVFNDQIKVLLIFYFLHDHGQVLHQQLKSIPVKRHLLLVQSKIFNNAYYRLATLQLW